MAEARRIRIDPITRLEGHGRVELFLDEQGEVEQAYFQIPELRGFEKFCEGRPAEDMPQITSRICGVCPTAHHMASVKALDQVFGVEPPPAARLIRELIYSAFFVEDHALHFYFLGAPDFVMGPTAPPAERNVLGVIGKLGLDVGQKVIGMRSRLREVMALIGGKAAHPVFGLPGGVAKPVHAEDVEKIRAVAAEAVDFAAFTLETFEKLVLSNAAYVDLILSDPFTHRTHYMGLVDEEKRVSFYDGRLRVVSPSGEETALFEPARYLDYIAERTEPWTYIKFCYLKPAGWSGFNDGEQSGVYAVAPMARLNAAESMATPLAQEARDKLFSTLGGRPVHHTLANHWARIVEMMQAAERMKELAADPRLTDPEVRTLPSGKPGEGVGVVEAPRGTLIHHYEADERGLIRKANLIVATQNNAARISMSVAKAARAHVHGGTVSEGVLNTVEMAYRAYDPCIGCATHALLAARPVMVRWSDRRGRTLGVLRRGPDGVVRRGEAS
jgi:F420-non-reducing hydrogenase large subunit